MTTRGTPPTGGTAEPADQAGARYVYEVPRGVYAPEDEISLIDLWNILWAGKWLGIAITLSIAVATAIISLQMTEWYRAEVLLAPAEERSAQGAASALGGLGGLAGLAGIRVGGGGSVEPMAVLRSRTFIRDFIEDLDLMPVLLAEQWDAEAGEWLGTDEAEIPDIRDAVKYFQDNVLSVSEDRETQLVTLAIEWTDPELAADWANVLVERLNDRMRQEALQEAETNVAYLQEALGATSLVTLQQSIGRLLETEMQKLMLARGNEQFSFKVLDQAVPPMQRFRPARTLMVALAIVLGGMLSVLVIFIRHAVRSHRAAPSPD